MDDLEQLVPPHVVQVARDLTAQDARVRSRAGWALLKPGVLDHVLNCARTRRAVLVNEIPLTDEVADQLTAAASILDRLPELQRDPDPRVRVAADEASALLQAWEDIETGRVQRPLLEGVAVSSIGVLRVYRDARSHWVRPLVRFAKRIGADIYVRLLGDKQPS